MLVYIYFDLFFWSSFLFVILIVHFIHQFPFLKSIDTNTHTFFSFNGKKLYKQPFKHHQERFLKKIFKLLLAYVINRKANRLLCSKQKSIFIFYHRQSVEHSMLLMFYIYLNIFSVFIII